MTRKISTRKITTRKITTRKIMIRALIMTAPVLLSLAATQVRADEPGLIEALQQGTAQLAFRLRNEDVEQQIGVDRGAQALTLRSRLSYQSAQYQSFSAVLEFDDVSALPDDENYNSASNGQVDDALVLDPEGTELNRVWLAYSVADSLIKVGRQRVTYDNQRFVGNDALRQNEQTFNGLSVFNESLNFLRLNFAYLNRVDGILGDAHPDGQQELSAQLFNIEYWAFPNSTLVAYGYLIDNASGVDVWDSATYGVRFSGNIENEPSVFYAFEYAVQSDAADNPRDYAAPYQLLELGGTYRGVRLKAGWEVLGADGAGFVVTPLASLHDFQGATAQFWNQGLGNISGGIRDRYLGLGYDFSTEFQVLALLHQFDSDERQLGPGDLGREWSLGVFKNWHNYRVSAKYADYAQDQYGIDTKQLWLSAEARF